MPRVKRGVAAHKKHKKLLQMVEGHRGTRKRLFRPAHESLMRKILAEMAVHDEVAFSALLKAALETVQQ